MTWHLSEAGEADLPEVARLVNAAYRGDEARAGWAHEADLIGGQRTDVETLSQDRANGAAILCLRDGEREPILACASVEAQSGVAVIGMVTVSPRGQNRGVGRVMLAAAEDHARARGCARARMTVIAVRLPLLAWYGRRGYRPTGETKPFPYGDERFGLPRDPGLSFVVLDKGLA